MIRSPLLETAIAAARAGEAVIRRYYRAPVDVSLKADQSPVTVADVETEQAIKQVIRSMFPDHGFYGEETGQERIDAEYVWLIDPIDGTKSFVREIPFFSTQIALYRHGEPVLGVSNAPLFDELACAEVGQGVWLNDTTIRVSEVDDFGKATLSTGNLATLARSDHWSRFGQIVADVNRLRGYGDFYHYHLLAAGKIDMIVESDVSILDVAALAVIIREAGGQVTDFRGQPLTLQSTSIIASNSRLHGRLLDRLHGSD